MFYILARLMRNPKLQQIRQVNHMYFDYDQYVRGCLIVSVFGTMFSLFIFIASTLRFVLSLKKQSLYEKVIFLLAILVSVFFLRMDGGILLHGGIHLLTERESDAIEMQGYISEIERLDRYSFPNLDSEYKQDEVNGAEFTIDGIQCKAIAKGNLEVGDYVTVKYLPKSGFVLHISKLDEESSIDGDRSSV